MKIAVLITDDSGGWETLYIDNVLYAQGHHVQSLPEIMISEKVDRLIRHGIDVREGGYSPFKFNNQYQVVYEDGETDDYLDLPYSFPIDDWNILIAS